jgi:hypothetical protein
MTNIFKTAIDLIVPFTQPLTEKEWDQLDEAVRALDDSMRNSGLVKQLEEIEVGGEGDKLHQEETGKIVICAYFIDVEAKDGLADGFSRVVTSSFDD